MKFFCDENLPPVLAAGMAGFGEDVVHVKDTHGLGTKDDVWLPWAGDEGIFVLTKDKNIRFNPTELRLLLRHDVGAFVLRGGGLPACKIIEVYVAQWRKIKRLAEKTPRPFLIAMRPNGGVFNRVDLHTGKLGQKRLP
jgi:predicted nuclease of predicted toxin-antitoxin system